MEHNNSHMDDIQKIKDLLVLSQYPNMDTYCNDCAFFGVPMHTAPCSSCGKETKKDGHMRNWIWSGKKRER